MVVTNVGFTASPRPLAAAQLAALDEVLSDRFEPGSVFRHGDCVGGDAQGHALAREAGYRLVIHPPSDHRARAFCAGDEVREPAAYLVRNHDIVDASDVLVAAPHGPEVRRSGEWATVRYARRVGVPVVVVWPDGSVESLDE